ncbi:MAG: hypothetical protein ACI9HK_001793, partial [Pirellulaceae bacterium]
MQNQHFLAKIGIQSFGVLRLAGAFFFLGVCPDTEPAL